MFKPSRALAFAAQADPLPDVPHLKALYDYGVRPRRGQLLMITGQPGSMKSTLAMWWAAQMNLRTLYFSADMDAHTASTRLAACLSGDSLDEITEAISGPACGYYEDVLADSKIQFCFDSAPTLDDIADEVSAYVEYWDAYPELIVVDNLMNIEAEMGESYQGLLLAMSEIHRVARQTGAALFILHHTTESTTQSSTEPQPRRDIQGKVTQLPELVMTVALDSGSNRFAMAPVKNRNGRADATGKTWFPLLAVPECASFTGYPHYYGER